MGFLATWKVIGACCRLENEMYEDKIKEGVNGLEWLVLQTEPDELMLESLASYQKLVTHVYKFNFNDLIRDTVLLDHRSFFKKYRLSWWATLSEGLTYLALLRQRNYDKYFDFIISITKSEFERGEIVES
ncbi:hypothetical protein [Metabacillus halosaccharovorans]|uniref:hypothetical protein n=1 Tax=Metabacillus halosaccharovorans TaxID=930124 RepID=UPI000995B403|nr:hypothetical protein [Metabacillus halosaccharovorans]